MSATCSKKEMLLIIIYYQLNWITFKIIISNCVTFEIWLTLKKVLSQYRPTCPAQTALELSPELHHRMVTTQPLLVLTTHTYMSLTDNCKIRHQISLVYNSVAHFCRRKDSRQLFWISLPKQLKSLMH